MSNSTNDSALETLLLEGKQYAESWKKYYKLERIKKSAMIASAVVVMIFILLSLFPFFTFLCIWAVCWITLGFFAPLTKGFAAFCLVLFAIMVVLGIFNRPIRRLLFRLIVPVLPVAKELKHLKKPELIELAKQEIKLDIKKQEYYLMKKFLKLKYEYNPINVATNLAIQILGDAEEEEVEVIDKETGETRKKRIKTQSKQMKRLREVFLNFLGLVDAYVGSVSNNFSQKIVKEQEEYVVGKDD